MSEQRTLFRGGTVLTIDPDLGVIHDGDVLVEGERIAAVGRGIEADGAEVVDASDSIIMPGFVDTHRHTWQAVLRSMACDWTLAHYFTGLHAGFSRHFRPQDTYLGNLLGMIDAMDAGVTTVLDWSHNLATPEHADAAIEGLMESGGRAMFAHGGGAPQWQVPSDVPHPDDVKRIREQYFSSDDQLVTMGLALRGPQFATKETTIGDYALAKEIGTRISVHVGDGEWGKTAPVAWLHEVGLTGPDVTYVHCNTLSDDELRLIADTGGTASVSPDIEVSMGHGWPATGRLVDAGVRPSLSIDVCTMNSGDMFGTMKATLDVQRGIEHAEAFEKTGGPAPSVSVSSRDVVEFGTIEGARAMGMENEIGSLTPGKRADLIKFNTRAPGVTPMINPFGTIVYSGQTALVDTVLINGKTVKKDGQLVDVDLDRIHRLAYESLDYLFEQAKDDPRISDAHRHGDWVPEPYEPEAG